MEKSSGDPINLEKQYLESQPSYFVNPMPAANVLQTAMYAADFARRPKSSAGALDFRVVAADTYFIYSPLDTPQGLWRGSVFLGASVSHGAAWEASHAC